MPAIDQAQFDFSPAAGIAVGFMVGFLVFAVALDVKWEQFRRVFRAPTAPGIGLFAQFIILPAVAFVVGRFAVDTPSVALGLLLVACCPGGALSNYFTGVARGDVATSVSMTAASTVVCVAATPLIFGFWASMNPATAGLLEEIHIDARMVIVGMMIMVVVPVAAGMLIGTRRPELARTLRGWVRRLSVLVFAVIAGAVIAMNARLLLDFAADALLPVVATFTIAVSLGWGLARIGRVRTAERRAIALEVAMQNVALAIGTAVAFFPAHAGVVVTGALWGVVHVAGGFALAWMWARTPRFCDSQRAPGSATLGS